MINEYEGMVAEPCWNRVRKSFRVIDNTKVIRIADVPIYSICRSQAPATNTENTPRGYLHFIEHQEHLELTCTI